MVIKKKEFLNILDRLSKAENALEELEKSFIASKEGASQTDERVCQLQEKVKEIEEVLQSQDDDKTLSAQQILQEYFYGKEDKE